MFKYTPPTSPYLEILHSDDAILIANKPAGLLSVPGRGEDKKDCLITRVQTQYPTALIVHRLDMATSGLVVLALDTDSHRTLSTAFQERKIEKRYLAWVSGNPTKDSGSIDFPLITDWPNRPLQKVDIENGKASLTHWEIINSTKGRTLVSLRPVTGRTHQLRVHMKEIGHPIIGDPLYADRPALQGEARLLLHAELLAFDHPITGDSLRFTCAPSFSLTN